MLIATPISTHYPLADEALQRRQARLRREAARRQRVARPRRWSQLAERRGLHAHGRPHLRVQPAGHEDQGDHRLAASSATSTSSRRAESTSGCTRRTSASSGTWRRTTSRSCSTGSARSPITSRRSAASCVHVQQPRRRVRHPAVPVGHRRRGAAVVAVAREAAPHHDRRQQEDAALRRHRGVEKVKIFDHGVNCVEPGSFGEFQLSYRTGDIVSPRLDAREPLCAEAQHFVECVRTGCRPRTDGASGLRVVGRSSGRTAPWC